MTHDVTPIVTTRLSLHAVAEHVLAADLYRRNGHIGLRQTVGGFGTPILDDGGTRHRVRVDGTDLVVESGGADRHAPISTLRAAGELVGIEPGGPSAVYPLATPLEPDAPLHLDAASARLLADWFALTSKALERLVAARPHDDATAAQLWPEHLDLAISAGEANYGGSPGDVDHPLPYLYVGPWRPPSGAGWNEAFGASLAWRDDLTVDEAAAFFLDRHDAWTAISSEV